MTRGLHRRKRQGGSSLVELALGSGILVAVFVGTFQFGYSFYIYNNLVTAVNSGAKYAALKTYEQTSSSPSTCFTTSVQDMVVYGDPTGTNTATIAPGLKPSNIKLNVTFSNGVPSEMTVYIASYSLNSIFANMSLTNKPSATYPYLGRYAPANTCAQ